jgi:hypothetical protein
MSTIINGSSPSITFSDSTTQTTAFNSSNAVTSVTAGTGISVSASTGASTITNTGVTSAVAGTNISVSGATGAVTISSSSYPLTSGTAVASTSGTSIDFTSIPSWVKRITVMFYGTSTSGTSNIWLQIGSSGTPQTTGYVGKSTSAFVVYINPLAAGTLGGSAVLTNPTGNGWVASGAVCQSDANTTNGVIGGWVSLSGTLNIVRITTANGTDTFDAGSLNILYE